MPFGPFGVDVRSGGSTKSQVTNSAREHQRLCASHFSAFLAGSAPIAEFPAQPHRTRGRPVGALPPSAPPAHTRPLGRPRRQLTASSQREAAPNPNARRIAEPHKGPTPGIETVQLAELHTQNPASEAARGRRSRNRIAPRICALTGVNAREETPPQGYRRTFPARRLTSPTTASISGTRKSAHSPKMTTSPTQPHTTMVTNAVSMPEPLTGSTHESP